MVPFKYSHEIFGLLKPDDYERQKMIVEFGQFCMGILGCWTPRLSNGMGAIGSLGWASVPKEAQPTWFELDRKVEDKGAQKVTMSSPSARFHVTDSISVEPPGLSPSHPALPSPAKTSFGIPAFW